MKKASQSYVWPLLIIIGGGFIYKILTTILTGTYGNIALYLFQVAVMFSLGVSLNYRSKKTQTWVKKLVIAFFMFFFIIWNLNYTMIPQLKQITDYLGIYGFVVHLIYVYCGWSFFD